MQFFTNNTHEKIDTPEISKDIQNKDKADNEDIEIDMKYVDDRSKDTLIEPSIPTKAKSKTLDICKNLPQTPIGITNGVIARIPVVLAQLIIPLSLTSTIDLPKSAIEIKSIKKSLRLTKCILLQPTNILFIKGFVHKSIEYYAKPSSNLKRKRGNINCHTIALPFECSTAVVFFTQPLDPIASTKELSGFNQINQEFLNENPFCKLLSSKIIEFDESIDSKESKKTSIQIQEKMIIELRLEVLQNQPIVIGPAPNSTIK